jgi:hypothetical protein
VDEMMKRYEDLIIKYDKEVMRLNNIIKQKNDVIYGMENWLNERVEYFIGTKFIDEYKLTLNKLRELKGDINGFNK